MKAVIFDFDGVIVDSEQCWEKYERKLFRELAPDWGESERPKVIGFSPLGIYEFIKKEHTVTLSPDQFLAKYDAIATTVYEQETSLLPGVKGLMDELRDHSISIAIASSGPMEWITMALQRLGLMQSFATICSAPTLNIACKPDPAVWKYCLRELNVDARDAIALEDSRNGVLSAKAAGLRCVGMQTDPKARQDLSAADIIVRSCEELSWNRLQAL